MSSSDADEVEYPYDSECSVSDFSTESECEYTPEELFELELQVLDTCYFPLTAVSEETLGCRAREAREPEEQDLLEDFDEWASRVVGAHYARVGSPVSC